MLILAKKALMNLHIFYILAHCGGGSQSHRVHYLVKMNRAFVCDLYQYEVKKESQRRGRDCCQIALCLEPFGTSHLTALFFFYCYFPLERKGFIKDLSVKI